MRESIKQWLTEGKIEKQRIHGLREGYSGVVFHPYDIITEEILNEYITDELLNTVVQTAIEKEEENEN